MSSPDRIVLKRRRPPIPDFASVMGEATTHTTAGKKEAKVFAQAKAPRVTVDMPMEEKMIKFIETLKVPDGPDVGQLIRLRDWQKDMIRGVYGPRRINDKGKDVRAIRQAIWTLARKNGKALSLDTKVQTPSGPRRIKHLGVGDLVFAIDGTPARIVAESPIFYDHDCYKITFRSGESFVVDAGHRWTVEHKKQVKTVTTKDIAWYKKSDRFKFPLCGAVQYPKQDFPLDPYTLGIWLAEGTGSTDLIHLNTADSGYILSRLGSMGRVWNPDRGCVKVRLGLKPKLRDLDLLKNKHLPEDYLMGSEKQRRELLRGLLDGDGHPTPAGGSSSSVTFTTKHKHLAKSVLRLVASLGFKPTMKSSEARWLESLGGVYGPYHTVNFTAYQEDYVFSLERQNALLKSRPSKKTRASYRFLRSIEKMPSVPVKCIGIDHPSHQFLIGDTFVPTHNTSLAAGLIVGHLTGPCAMWNGQLFSVAFEVGQAALSFRAVGSMVMQDVELAGRIVLTESSKRAVCTVSNSVFRSLSSESRSKHGLNPQFVLFDEFSQFGQDRRLFDVMMTSMGAQDNPLGLVISTQASEDSAVLSELIDYGREVNAGRQKDETFHLTEYSVPHELDAWDEKNWKLANPALGDFRSLDEMRQYAIRARSLPSMENSFRNLYLNQRVTPVATFVTDHAWSQCAGDIDMDALEGVPCWGGLDLSSKIDLTALVLAFDTKPEITVLPFFFTPKDTMAERSKRDKVPYEKWAELGYIEAIPGNAIDFRFVAQRIAELSAVFNIQCIGFDRWRIEVLKTWFDEYGIEVPMTPIGQGFKDGTLMVETVENAILNVRLRHNSHPILKWNALNVNVIRDPAGNRKFDKSSRTARIDGFVALAMALRASEMSEAPTDMNNSILII